MNFKPLPESKWNITFSGEEDRLELLDFLEKIDIFSSVERTRKNEVLRSAFHLFKGQAREWYMASRHRFDSYDTLVTELKKYNFHRMTVT
jgi:hypothetical protein